MAVPFFRRRKKKDLYKINISEDLYNKGLVPNLFFLV